MAGDVRGVVEPPRWGIKEVEIGGDGDDGDLREVENAKPIPTAGFFVGAGKEHHEDRSGPDEEEDVRGHRHLRGAGNVALIVGGDGLGEGFEGEGDTEERPELASIALGETGGVERAESGKENGGEIERVGEEKALSGVLNGDEVKEEERRYKEGDGDEEPGKLAMEKQADLKGHAWRNVSSAGTRVRVSVHQRSARGRGMFTKL